jgi:hypothetical protein
MGEAIHTSVGRSYMHECRQSKQDCGGVVSIGPYGVILVVQYMNQTLMDVHWTGIYTSQNVIDIIQTGRHMSQNVTYGLYVTAHAADVNMYCT